MSVCMSYFLHVELKSDKLNLKYITHQVGTDGHKSKE